MSSYNQVAETRPLAETLSLAATEIMSLEEEMADLCATIAAQFPDTHERIDKYQQAYCALQALRAAHDLVEDPLAAVTPSYRNVPITVKVGRQTRHNRPSSQRVRLANAVVRLRAVAVALHPDGADEATRVDLKVNIDVLEHVTFPKRYG